MTTENLEPRRPKLRRVDDRVHVCCANNHRVADLDDAGTIHILCRCKKLVDISPNDIESFRTEKGVQ